MAELEKIKVLIVEDDLIPAYYLKEIVEEDGEFEVVAIASSANEAYEIIKSQKIDIIFMDIMLKGAKSGAELALELRREYDDILIIFLTAYVNDEITDYAVESQAFAYLVKPYRPDEIQATLKLAKSKKRHNTHTAISKKLKLIDGYIYNLETNRLYKDGKEVKLSEMELKLVQTLCRHCDITLSKETLLHEMGLNDDALRALIYRVRKNTTPELIQSIKRFGYRIALN